MSEAKLNVVRELIERASDSVVRGLEQSLLGGGDYDETTQALYAMVSRERVLRRTQSLVFAPILGPFTRRERVLPTLQYPPDTLKLLWRDLSETDSELIQRAMQDVSNRADVEVPSSFDKVCKAAAERVAAGETPSVAERIGKSPKDMEQLAQLLRLAPILRAVIPKLEIWLRNLNGDNVAAVRLAFKDAVNVADDGGLLLLEIFCAQMNEPWQVLRLISAVMDRPSDRFLAQSELAIFGERIIEDIDRRIDLLKRFDPSLGTDAAVEMAANVRVIVNEIAEFEGWITLGRAQGWGQKIYNQKRALALAVEARLKDGEGAVNKALPLAAKPFGVKVLRAPAKLTEDPDPAAVNKAEALLIFSDGVRSSAALGGFGSFRAKMIEILDERLDHYAEDLIDRLATDGGRSGPPRARVQAFLDIAARFVGLVRDTQAADIIRRRSASASAA